MHPLLYHPTFIICITVLCVLTAFRYLASSGYALQKEQGNIIFPFIISTVLVLWLGFRPISVWFGDSIVYAGGYNRLVISEVSIDWSKEWVWNWLSITCKAFHLDVQSFFAIVEAGYIYSILWAVQKFTPTNPMLGMLFALSSLMFYQFGVNGLRNGLACHMILLGLAFILDNKYTPGILISLAAFGVHRSVMLPIASFAVGFLFKDKIKYALLIWLASIPLSIVLGGTAINFFASLGFDDRMTSYTNGSNDMDVFSSTGFRWDFLLYSFFPILMIWYVCIKRKIVDYWFNILSITYCLSNAFWVMVITASYSNRFAYLSWFMYPIIIAYPLINLPLWNDQDRKTGLILLAYCGFSYFMNMIVW